MLSLLLSPALFAANREILLWPNGAPGSEGKTGDEIVGITKEGYREISNVHKPSITPYLPSKRKATGCAVIVAPGGGHKKLCMGHEGENVAAWLKAHGIAAFVLKYRLAKETNSTYTVDGDALADIQRAILVVRSRAKEWGINPDHIGVMGFSAGGELAALAAQGKSLAGPNADAGQDPIDGQRVLPAFQALIYPGQSQRIEPTTNSPPAFLACGYQDRKDISEGLATVYLKFKQVKVPAELHIYSGSGHGFGVRANNTQPVGKWTERFEEWLADNGFLKKP